MRVLFLQQQPCIRTLKYAVGLRAASDGLQLGFAYQGRTLGEWYGTGDDAFDRWWNLGTGPDAEVVDRLGAVVDEFRPDVIHSHNLPDRLTVLAVDLAGGTVPVIHDVHDFQSLRRTPYEDGLPEPADPLAAERAAVEGCSALVTVSPELLAEVEARYQVPPTLVFPNYALARDLPMTLPAWRPRPGEPPRIVYQGTLSTNGGHYDLRGVFRRVVAGGALLDVYPSRPSPDYEVLAEETPGLRLMDRLDPRALMQALPAYDFGWAGFNDSLNAAHLHTALPNKLFEYLGCGLPVLTTGHRAIARFLGEHGVGVDLGGPAGAGDVASRLAAVDVAALRRRVAAARFDFTIEANLQPVVDLYKTVVG
ncbi:MAG TPA: glycosyltransferase [Acidimicrobiales bacterium]|jgi:glycosyltransferase involved in cell wall biosynthesis|nr:glycosyltransferase [Acidimicrobiales bacterium]